MTTNVVYENELYEVRVIEDALDEDNRSRNNGYGIFNKSTGIREATGLVFGEVRWRADQFAGMVKELDERAEAEANAETDPLADAADTPDDDVTIN